MHIKSCIRSTVCLCLLLTLTACGGPSESQLRQEIEQTVRDEIYQQAYTEGYSAAQAQPKPLPEATPSPQAQAGFVSVSDVIPDVLLEIRYYSTYNFVGKRLPGYEEPVALLTKEATDALHAVSDELIAKGYRLKIYDAYRPQQAVDYFKAWAKDLDDTCMKPYFYPARDKSVLFKEGYISSHSGHSRGSTVDLTLFDMATGKEVDMGGTFDWFDPISHANRTEGLTAQQIANRALLRDAMTAHGFKSMSTEWWHYTLQDEPYPDTYFDFPVAHP